MKSTPVAENMAHICGSDMLVLSIGGCLLICDREADGQDNGKVMIDAEDDLCFRPAVEGLSLFSLEARVTKLLQRWSY